MITKRKRPLYGDSLGRSWFICLMASLFFFYEFIQMNMFNAISVDLMKAFDLTASGLGKMSSYYFIANVIFLFPAGMLLDRYSTRLIILISLAICIIGTGAFAFAHTLGWATFFRFLTGIGSAFCFLSVIRLSTRWFPAAHLALVTGVVVTMAMIGGMVAQTPMMLLVEKLQWRNALLVDAGLGIFIFIMIALFVKDFPSQQRMQHQRELAQLHTLGYWRSLGLAFLKLQNWLGGIYTSLMNLPISLLGGLWGVMYLMDAHGLTKLQAPSVTMMLFFGTIVGGPLVGELSDYLRLRRWPMMLGSVISLFLMMLVILMPGLTFTTLIVLFFLIGVSTSTQIIGYPTVAESSLPAITAMSVSVVNITTQGGQAIFQRVFGDLMDMHSVHLTKTGWVYTSGDFHWPMLIFPAGFILAFFAAFCLRETYAKSQLDKV